MGLLRVGVGGVSDSFTYLMDPFRPTGLPQPVQTEFFCLVLLYLAALCSIDIPERPVLSSREIGED